MAIKVKLGKKNGSRVAATLRHPVVRILLLCMLLCVAVGAGVFGYLYLKYQKIVDARLAAGPMFANVTQIYAAPREVRVGQHLTVEFIAQSLGSAGYNVNPRMGTYTVDGNSIAIKPGPQSYYSSDGATITTGPSSGSSDAGYVVKKITAGNGAELEAYKLEPQLITSLSEGNERAKRRLVTYKEIPQRMVQAVTSIEDRRFFEHHGVNYVRTVECAVHDLLAGRRDCGGSTLTQQLAKNFFLTPDKTISRKVSELMITYQLEARFSKPEIFAMYANEVNLVHRGSYEIDGIAEASQILFGKDLQQLDLAQTATIAALFRNPSYYSPYFHHSRTLERRNLVLQAMVETGAITQEQADKAKAEPLELAKSSVDAGEAPYFVDMVHDQLAQRIGDEELNHDSLRIYTSLDPDLQRAASDAVEAGMKNVDELIRKLHRKKDTHITYPQVALVALNPHTGQVLALVGGRNYGISQLNHAMAERPTGSIFKPIVYAEAYNTSLDGTNLYGDGVFTALTKLNDDPQDFVQDGKDYEPGNFEKGEYPGMVPAVEAIAHSLNIATINLAQQVGYDKVASLARDAGIASARGTPSVAIGTYSATPIDMAGVYTMFANNGVHLKPWMLASVRNSNGDIVADFTPEAKQVLDPKVAYLTQSLLENVMTFGTGSSARAHGFTAPAAGKTGTSHDVWFAGYTSNLLCIVWIGNDDYTDISKGLTHSVQGADTAAPIWAEFMNRAIKLPQYSDVKPFSAPDGVEVIPVDRNTWLPADASCPEDFSIAFLDGTVPNATCSHMGDNPLSFFQRLFGGGPNGTPAANPQQPPPAQGAPPPGQPVNQTPRQAPVQTPSQPSGQPAPPQKRTFFQKLFGVGKKQPEQDKQPQ
ncbi:MAG TPA: transglycosylase domain-containing protein [Acidobacteriaceae bacterium]|nr:transglycosylase domain-containing protein [Acidobacteriaceae bacterium]